MLDTTDMKQDNGEDVTFTPEFLQVNQSHLCLSKFYRSIITSYDIVVNQLIREFKKSTIVF